MGSVPTDVVWAGNENDPGQTRAVGLGFSAA